jgi:anti-repressor protein
MSNELINITESNGKKAVHAKELYLGLGLDRSQWARWCKTNIIFNDFFLENESWIGVRHNVEGNDTEDFVISIEFAKHIAMMARTPKSHDYRNYFLECEKQMNQPIQIDSKMLFQIATQLEEKEKQIQLMQPKADFFDAVAESKDAIDIGSASKVLNMGIGRNKLFEILRDKGILMHNNQPYQKFVDRGYFRVIEQKFTKPDGSTSINIKTLVYQKGLDYIRKQLA